MINPQLQDAVLRCGSHSSRERGMCAMELAAYLAGEEHSDRPRCVHPDLRDLIVALNDSYDDDRQRTDELLPLVLASIGTAGAVMDIAPLRTTYENAITTAQIAYDDAIDTAQKACDEATAPAQKVYHATTDAARTVYDDAIAAARTVYDDAIAAARTVYDDAITAARRVYDDAIAAARRVYEDTIAPAQNIYHDAIDTARRHCIAALLAECSRCRAEKESTITTTYDEGVTQ